MNVEVSNLKNQDLITKLVYYSCNYLKIEPSCIKCNLLEVEDINGMCIDLSDDEFLILIKDHDSMFKTLVHELVHVKQYMKQNLGYHLNTRSGEYETAWWEQEARQLSKQIMESYNEYSDPSQ